MLLTNKTTQTLEDTLKSTIPNTKAFDILVGYFYFSGFAAIHSESLKDIPLRILVGLEAQKDMRNHILEIEQIDGTISAKSRAEIRRDYYEKFCEIFNSTDFYDSESAIKSFALFCSKIKDGSLQIRKTKEPNHSKMYILSYKDESNSSGVVPGMVVVGSSNLSLHGLRDRYEINSVMSDKADYDAAVEIFEELWNSSIELADKDHWTEFEEGVISRIWFDKVFQPFLVYLKVLDEYFSLEITRSIRTPNEINKNYKNFRYQIDAVKMSLDIIDKHNGVIIADVVGLGKSIIASVLANNLALNTIIISPPHLISQWESYAAQFKIMANVFSSGKIQAALDFYVDNGLQDRPCLIVIDEAHRYRNEETQDYAMLHDLCMGNKVALLTATPFNNTPSDIFSMIKLFQIPSKSTLQTVSNLGSTFKNLISEYKRLQSDMKKGVMTDAELKVKIEVISKEIRTIIEPLVVRRSRLDLKNISVYRKDLERQGISFPVVADPEIKTYDLDFIQDKYVNTLQLISPTENNRATRHYKAARYQSLAYVDESKLAELKKELNKVDEDFDMVVGRQQSLSDFMKRLLVRRFESSVYAFFTSLQSMIDTSQEILHWIESTGKIPVFKKGDLPDPEMLFNVSGEEAEANARDRIKSLEGKGFYTIDIKYIKKEFVEDIKSDISILEEIKQSWFDGNSDFKAMVKTDPKIKAFIELLRDQLKHEPNRKIVVFSEFSDTINYISSVLKEKGLRVFKYSSEDASEKNKDLIKANFDAGVKADKQKNDFDILTATDAIAEGYSLHRAGTIFNYDIPYNPTRVIQRVGRINRVNKKVFDTLYIYNFFPSLVGETETKTKAISTLKMAMIQSIMGEDTKILTDEESLNSYFVERFRKENAAFESESWESKHRETWESYQDSPEMDEARKIPYRTRIARTSDKDSIVVFGKRDSDYIFKERTADGLIKLLSPQEALGYFRCEIDEEGHKVSSGFTKNYNELKKDLFLDNSKDSLKDRLKALDKLKAFKGETSDKDYILDLERVIKDYDALPKYELRMIGNATKAQLKDLQKHITRQYLDRIMKSVNQMEGKTEIVVLTEEFIKGGRK